MATQTFTQTLTKRSNTRTYTIQKNYVTTTATTTDTGTSPKIPKSSSSGTTNSSIIKKRVPTNKPPFTVGDIRRIIPSHCFQHSYIHSYMYLLIDISMSLVLLYGSTLIEPYFSYSSPLSFLYHQSSILSFIVTHSLWSIYWITQGIVFTGLWVIGHECGHGGFSGSERINDFTGFIIHSLLMVPYYSWKISHRRHHSNTGNIERDEVFVPDVNYDQYAPNPQEEDGSMIADSHHNDMNDDTNQNTSILSNQPNESDNYVYDYLMQLYAYIQRLFWIVIMLTLGWPSYLIMNISSNKSYPSDRWISHFTPNSPIFQSSQFFGKEPPRQDKLVIFSDLGLLMTIGLLWKFSTMYGFTTIVYTYILPLMQNIMWLVIITYLQHTDKQLPHYDSSEWDWLRGALATVDRDYGILNYFFHHIGNTHVVHHIFHQMPFYHAREATDAVKPLLKEYYCADTETPIFVALWKNYGECETVSPDEKQKGVYWFN